MKKCLYFSSCGGSSDEDRSAAGDRTKKTESTKEADESKDTGGDKTQKEKDGTTYEFAVTRFVQRKGS